MTDTIDTESSGTENHAKKHQMPSSLKDKLQDVPEALDYIEKLQKSIRKQKKKLKKLKSKFKRRLKVEDKSVQTEEFNYDNGNSVVENSQAKSIAEEITEAAELATQNSGFVYDESAGMYYDSKSGYYYNAEYGLYYEPSSGTYFSYNQDTNTYEFHSQVHLPPRGSYKEMAKRKKKRKEESKASKYARVDEMTTSMQETEEGECSQSSISDASESDSDNSEMSKQWPPCMRIIVEQSQLPKIKTGSLYILTYEGGTLGREGDHAIILPDINISKSHLKFTFDKETNKFSVTDLGSRNGTILNGKRMSNTKQESESLEVAHGSRIQIGSLILLCHVHDGNKTCGHCEPGLLQVVEKEVPVFMKKNKSQQHKSELKKLRKKFGVNPFEDVSAKLAVGYTDRAQKRRDKVGSQNPHEKTEVASLNESISSKNKGFKMLSKMGWKEGESLGKDNQGMLEPIKLVSNSGTSGMGSSEPVVVDQTLDKNKQIIWKKTQERFKQISITTNVFDESD